MGARGVLGKAGLRMLRARIRNLFSPQIPKFGIGSLTPLPLLLPVPFQLRFLRGWETVDCGGDVGVGRGECASFVDLIDGEDRDLVA